MNIEISKTLLNELNIYRIANQEFMNAKTADEICRTYKNRENAIHMLAISFDQEVKLAEEQNNG